MLLVSAQHTLQTAAGLTAGLNQIKAELSYCQSSRHIPEGDRFVEVMEVSISMILHPGAHSPLAIFRVHNVRD
jgi:hypothetical protein